MRSNVRAAATRSRSRALRISVVAARAVSVTDAHLASVLFLRRDTRILCVCATCACTLEGIGDREGYQGLEPREMR
jgi:hypothetical protein